MIAPRIHRVATHDGPLAGHPEQRVVDAVSLHRAQQHHGLAVEAEEAEGVRGGLGGGARREVLGPVDGRPVLDLLVVLALDAGADVGRGEEFGGGVGLEDGVGAEVVLAGGSRVICSFFFQAFLFFLFWVEGGTHVRVVMRHEHGGEIGVGRGGADPIDYGFGILE